MKINVFLSCFTVVFVANVAPVLAEEVTWTKHIAPIIYNNCTECHRPNVGAPFVFETYEQVKKKAELIQDVTQSRFMPIWVPERGNIPIHGERGLEDDEIDLIAAWVNQGTPEGDPADLPVKPTFPEGWQLGTPDVIVTMEGEYVIPAEGPDIYHNFVVHMPELPKGKWIKGVEVRPSSMGVVHHCLIDLDTSGSAMKRDLAEPGPGFSGMENAYEDMRIGGYAVGARPRFYPDGVALPLPEGGGDMILEMHFNPTGKEEREKTQVGIYLTDVAPTRQADGILLPAMFGLASDMDIPAGEKAYAVTDSYTLPVDVDLFACIPHAHYLCKEAEALATLPDGKVLTLLRIHDWNFAWQEQYIYENLVPLPKGTRIDMKQVYDNSAENPHNPHNPPKRVTWGPNTTDEMAGIGFLVMPVNPQDITVLEAAYAEYRENKVKTADPELMRPIVVGEIYRRFDKNKDGTLSVLEKLGIAKFGINEWRMSSELNLESQKVEEILAMRTIGKDIRDDIITIGGGILLIVLAILAALVYALRRIFRRQRPAHA